MKFNTFLLLTLFFGSALWAQGQTELFINKGITTLNDLEVGFTSFNSSPELSPKNENLTAGTDEIIEFEITNNDSLVHSFTIDGVVDEVIEPGTTASFSFSISEPGTYRYYSSYSYGQKAGASGILLIGYEEYPSFFWNLFDIEDTLSQQLTANEINEVPLDYQPELFFINGASYPETLDDEQTLIAVTLDSEIVISVVNSGSMDHAMHFHGFHVEILDAGILDHYTGWIKDTVPFSCGETMTLKLTANQLGIYPVHDHNLIAVTNIGFYPGGMLTQIVVTE